MAGPVNLTQASVRALNYTRTDGQPEFVWDRTMTGLGVRLTSGGAQSYVLRYRVRGRTTQRLATLGATNRHSVTDARAWARQQLSLADKGTDFQAAAEQQRALGTVAALWARYTEQHVKVHCSGRTAEVLKSLWTAHLEKPFGSRLLSELSTTDVAAWHRRVSEAREVEVASKRGAKWTRVKGGAYTANRALQLLRALINWQIKQGTLPPDFRNPCVGVQTNREKPRDVILRPAELPALAKAIEAHRDPFARAFVWLALHTGARRNELLTLRWEHVDLAGKRVTFVDTKNHTDRSVPLAPDAVRILKKLPHVDENPHVFPGHRDNGHRADLKGAWHQIRAAAGLPHLRLHDLRRSVGSWLGASGHTAPMIGELLGHKSDVTSRVYIKLQSLDVKRELVSAHAGLIKSALKKRLKKQRA